MKKDHPGLCCRIVGEGPERSRLETLSINLGLAKNVIFHDYFPGAAIYGVMKSAKVFALPSEREGFGIVALEANACGVPVVTADHPDNATRHLIVAGENGFLTTVDAASLAESLSIAINRASSMDRRASARSRGYCGIGMKSPLPFFILQPVMDGLPLSNMADLEFRVIPAFWSYWARKFADRGLAAWWHGKKIIRGRSLTDSQSEKIPDMVGRAMYVKGRRPGKTKNGAVRYLQFAHNEWDAADGNLACRSP